MSVRVYIRREKRERKRQMPRKQRRQYVIRYERRACGIIIYHRLARESSRCGVPWYSLPLCYCCCCASIACISRPLLSSLPSCDALFAASYTAACVCFCVLHDVVSRTSVCSSARDLIIKNFLSRTLFSGLVWNIA